MGSSRNAASPRRKKRRYASYFDWHIKGRKELGVLEELIRSMEIEGPSSYHSPRIQDPDPPDCSALDAQGALVGFEIAELVSEDAVRRTEQGETLVSDWTPHMVALALNSILLEKDGKSFVGGPYARIAVLVHTDEYLIAYDEVRPYVEGRSFGPFKTIDEAYLLLSYNPYYQRCPFLRLDVSPRRAAAGVSPSSA